MKRFKNLLATTACTIAASAAVVSSSIVLSSCSKDKEMKVEIQPVKEDGTVVVLATGGTIAGAGEAGKETGYKPGSISAETLINAVPGIKEVAPIVAQQVCNINSDDITAKIWVYLTKTINKYINDYGDKIKGFVVLHGTDTMEETAYYLNLTVNTKKPVVITGSMRPATAISADGPMNLYQSVVVAHSDEAYDKGVLGVFSDQIFSARSMQKESTFDVTAISAGPMGAMGFVRNKEVFIYEQSTKYHTDGSQFTGLFLGENPINDLPSVETLYFQVDTNPKIIDWAKNSGAKGLVIAGAGAGEYSDALKSKIQAAASDKFPIVISSRIDSGVITQDSVLVSTTVAANDLPPHKAAILLRLALSAGITSQGELINLFKNY